MQTTTSPLPNPDDEPGRGPQRSGLPMRGSLFTDPAAQAIWAAVQALDEASKHDLLGALADHLALAHERGGGQAQRTARAVAALREAHELLRLGAEPNADVPPLSELTYRRLREEHPECEWPPVSNLTRWLGGGWNDALKRAHLPTVPGEDVTKVTLGGAFTPDEIIQALNDCASELGRVPSFMDYRRWASSPEVKVRPGRRPSSQPPFDRVFDTWTKALQAAGMIDVTDTGVATGGGLSHRPRGYRYRPAQMHKALCSCAEDLGRSPRVSEYLRWRGEQQRLDDQAGRPPQARPQHSVFNRLYPTWDDALIDAGLEPLGGRATFSVKPVFPARDGHRYDDTELIRSLAQALEELGDPVSQDTYRRWRTKRLTWLREQNPDAQVPGHDVIMGRLGGWRKARRLAREYLPAQTDQPRRDGGPSAKASGS